MRDASLSSVGTVKTVGVGVYWENSCSSRIASVDWGLVEPCSVENVTVFHNVGNALVSLSMNTTNWTILMLKIYRAGFGLWWSSD